MISSTNSVSDDIRSIISTIYHQQEQRIPPFKTIITYLLIIFSVHIINILYHVHRKYDKKYPPFAPGGMFSHIFRATKSTYAWWLLEQSRQFPNGIFQISMPFKATTHFFVISEPNVTRQILSDTTVSKPAFYKLLRHISGSKYTMLTMSMSHGWYMKRKAARSAFSSNHVKRMTKVALDKTEQWIQNTLLVANNNNNNNNKSNNRAVFDASTEMIGIVLSALIETAFEYTLSKSEIESFTEDLNYALIEFTRKSANPIRRWLGRLIPERRRAYEAVTNLQSVVRHMMTTYRNKKEKHIDGTIIQLVMEADDAFPTDEEKTAQLMEFVMAGHDTTAYTIAWTLLCLAKHPEEQTKLRESLAQYKPENWSHSEHLQRVIKEGMRLYPVARSARIIGRDIMTSSGLLPKGSICSLNFLCLFRNPKIYDDPDSYLPSRWINPTQEMKDSFIPFSMGKQNCIGQSLARAELFAVVARICSEFELSVECEGSSDRNLTLKPVGMRLRAHRV